MAAVASGLGYALAVLAVVFLAASAAGAFRLAPLRWIALLGEQVGWVFAALAGVYRDGHADRVLSTDRCDICGGVTGGRGRSCTCVQRIVSGGTLPGRPVPPPPPPSSGWYTKADERRLAAEAELTELRCDHAHLLGMYNDLERRYLALRGAPPAVPLAEIPTCVSCGRGQQYCLCRPAWRTAGESLTGLGTISAAVHLHAIDLPNWPDHCPACRLAGDAP